MLPYEEMEPSKKKVIGIKNTANKLVLQKVQNNRNTMDSARY